jgi:hypothetical protein
MDMLSKMAYLISILTTIKAEGAAKLYFENIYPLYELPKAVISNRDTEFTKAFWRALQKIVSTDLVMSSMAHSQTDEQTKRIHWSVLQILHHFLNTVGSD